MSTTAFEGWAIVEMMGHRRVAGRVSETEIAGAKLLRIDVPGDGADDFCTQFIGGAAIYCLTPTGEKEARAVAAASRPAPVTRFELPEPKAIPAAPELGDEFDDVDALHDDEEEPGSATDEARRAHVAEHGIPIWDQCREAGCSKPPAHDGEHGPCPGCANPDEAPPPPTADELRHAAIVRIGACTKCAIPAAFEGHTCRESDHDLVCKTTRGCYLAPGHAGDCDTAPF